MKSIKPVKTMLLTILLIAGFVVIAAPQASFALTIPGNGDGGQTEAGEACKDQKGDDNAACLKGFLAGYSGGSDNVCDSLSTTQKLICQAAFKAGSEKKDTDDGAKTGANDACKDKSGDEKDACIKGYNAGASGGSKDVCNSLSEVNKLICQAAFDAASSKKDGDGSGGSGSGDSNPCDTKGAYCPKPDPAAKNTSCSSDTNCSSIFNDYLIPAINLLSAAVGVIVVAVIIFSGIQFTASSGDPSATAAAKKRIQGAIIALLLFMFLWAFLNFLIPGGLFNGDPANI